MEDRIPQNIADTIKEIGENYVIFRLFALLKNNNSDDWTVYKNFSERGTDIILFNKESRRKIQIEVKTRQRIITTSMDRNIVHFTLTKLERQESDFAICNWILEDKIISFIVPKLSLLETKSNNDYLYKFIATKNKMGDLNESSKLWANNWNLLLEQLK